MTTTRQEELAEVLSLGAEDPRVARYLTRATRLIARRLTGNPDADIDAIPGVSGEDLDGIVVEVAAGLVDRSDRLAGSSQFADPATGGAARGPRDPLATVEPMLARMSAGLA